MNRFTRRGLAAAAAILPVAALTGEARAQGSVEPAIDRVQRTKTLRISALPGEAPYFVKDLASGTWKRRLHRDGRQNIASRCSTPRSSFRRIAPTATRCWICSRIRSTSLSR